MTGIGSYIVLTAAKTKPIRIDYSGRIRRFNYEEMGIKDYFYGTNNYRTSRATAAINRGDS